VPRSFSRVRTTGSERPSTPLDLPRPLDLPPLDLPSLDLPDLP